MAQNLINSIAGQKGGEWVASYASTTAALASSMSGTSEPGSSVRVPGMLWFDTTTSQLKIRNAADNAWVPVQRRTTKVEDSGWSTSFTRWVICPARAALIESVRMVSTTATTSDGSNNYNIDVYNVTDSHSLFSTTQTTNGSEFVANTVKILTPDQNATITASDAVEFRVVANGSPTSLTRVGVFIDWIALLS